MAVISWENILEIKCKINALVGQLIFCNIMEPAVFIFQCQTVSVYSITLTMKNNYNTY